MQSFARVKLKENTVSEATCKWEENTQRYRPHWNVWCDMVWCWRRVEDFQVGYRRCVQ